MLDRVRADLVLLDLWMPVMSGSAFVEELHNRAQAAAGNDLIDDEFRDGNRMRTKTARRNASTSPSDAGS